MTDVVEAVWSDLEKETPGFCSSGLLDTLYLMICDNYVGSSVLNERLL